MPLIFLQFHEQKEKLQPSDMSNAMLIPLIAKCNLHIGHSLLSQ